MNYEEILQTVRGFCAREKLLDGKKHLALAVSGGADSMALLCLMRPLAEEKGTADGKGFCVELCGVCTDICVVSNALLLKAALPEADFIVNGALCAGVTPQKHEAALETMRSCQIEVC